MISPLLYLSPDVNSTIEAGGNHNKIQVISYTA